MAITNLDEVLATMPLAAAVKKLLRENASAIYQEQIVAIEQELAGVVTRAARGPLTEACNNLREAQRQSSLPVQVEIARAVSAILREAGVAIRMHKAAETDTPRQRRPRVSEEQITRQVLQALPKDTETGLSGKMLAKECGVSYQTIRRHLVSIQDQGLIVRQGTGPGTTWCRASK